MTNHLTDNQLNEILDRLADTATLRHVDTCSDCRARLDDLRLMFAMLESLPEVTPPRDLTASILTRLPQRQISPTWKWLFAAQATAALAIVASQASSFALPPEIATYQPPTLDSLLASVIGLISSLKFELPTLNYQVSAVDLQSTTILLFVVSAVVLWLVGNGLLLRGTTSRSRK